MYASLNYGTSRLAKLTKDVRTPNTIRHDTLLQDMTCREYLHQTRHDTPLYQC